MSRRQTPLAADLRGLAMFTSINPQNIPLYRVAREGTPLLILGLIILVIISIN